MSSRILTSHFSGLEEFLQQHAALLAKSTDGTVAVFANNAPAFYALTPARLAQLLAEAAAPDPGVLDGDPAVWLGTVRARVPADPATEHPSAWLPGLEFVSGTPDDIAAPLARLDAFWAGRNAWLAAAKAAQAGLQFESRGSGQATGQSVPANTLVEQGTRVIVNFSP